MKMDTGAVRLRKPSDYQYRVSGHNKMIKLPNGKVGCYHSECNCRSQSMLQKKNICAMSKCIRPIQN